MFTGVNENLVYCIHETKVSEIIDQFPSTLTLNCTEICYKNEYFYCLEDECPEEYQFLIMERKECIKDCSFDKIYKYEYNKTCYKYPIHSENISEDLNFILKEFSIKNKSIIINDAETNEIINNISNLLLNASYEKIISEIKDGDDIIIENKEIKISITSTDNQKKINKRI